MRFWLLALIAALCNMPTASAQNAKIGPKKLLPKLVIAGGGFLPANVYQEFRELAGTDPSLIVIPTASKLEFDAPEIQKLWKTRGFANVTVLHGNNHDVASSIEFVEPLKTATAVWFGGGSQQRLADAYVGTLVEKELHQLLRRGGVIGGSSAGAAIQSRRMIASGRNEPNLSTGLGFLPGAIIDQHFLKRNRLARLLVAVRAHPDLVGFGIDEGTALVSRDGNAKVVGESYVLRIESIEGMIKLDAFNHGDAVPLAKPTATGHSESPEH